jgi:preprotein translocase subunit YajC
MSELLTAGLVAATKAKSTSTLPLLIIAVLIGVFYFFVLRPRAAKQKAARAQVKAAEVGDEIATIGGLVGTIVAEDGDRVTISTGNGTELVFLRQAIGRKIQPEPVQDARSDVDGDATDGETDQP